MTGIVGWMSGWGVGMYLSVRGATVVTRGGASFWGVGTA